LITTGVNESKTQATIFSIERKSPKHPILEPEHALHYKQHEKYRCIKLDKRPTFKARAKMVHDKAVRTYTKLFSTFETERLNPKAKFAPFKLLIKSILEVLG
jgi:hypothetical protein